MPEVIGVVGAGTMGAGIAQLAAAAGARTLLHDPVPEARERGLAQIADGLERWRSKGRLEREPGEVAGVAELEALAEAGLVIEAAPERLELKRELFAALSAVAPDAVLASNTSSIPITAIASAAADPGRVVGMHFFNPAPIMALVEVIAGIDSSPQALAVARATGEAMGKHVIDATDGPGFLVNR
jgi:3-hydroxybutyryl-CoA dehydrogenase